MSFSRLPASVRQAALLACLAAIPAVGSFWWHRAHRERDGFPRMPAAGIPAWREAIVWVDVRSPDAFRRSALPGAINLPENAWNEKIDGFLDVWEPGKMIVVYGATGDESAAIGVARRLKKEANIADGIMILEGGFEAWEPAKP